MFNCSINQIPIIRDDGRVIGKVEGNVFYKEVKASKHFLRIPPAISFDVKSLEDAVIAGASTVVVLDQETGKKYSASIYLIIHCGFKVNRGFGNQIALRLSKWQIVGETEQLPLFREIS